MHHPGDDFFSGAGFAKQKNGEIGAGDDSDALGDLFEAAGSADDVSSAWRNPRGLGRAGVPLGSGDHARLLRVGLMGREFEFNAHPLVLSSCFRLPSGGAEVSAAAKRNQCLASLSNAGAKSGMLKVLGKTGE
jgi:hypothetical protein